MSQLKIQERFPVPAPPEAVWAFLMDPHRVVKCLPGATLDRVEGGCEFHGGVTVAVGPVTVNYTGCITFDEVDEGGRRISMSGTGREAKGSGSASMTMVSAVHAAEGGSELEVTQEVRVTGKIVRFGRGMIERVGAEVFREFLACASATLTAEAEGDGGTVADAAADAAGARDADGRDAEPASEPSAVAGATPAESGAASEASSGEGAAGRGEARDGGAAGARGPGAGAAPKPASGLSFLFRAIARWLRELFGGR